jgi:hypothetical protein
MTEEKARAFAIKWITAWNNHDLKAILSHYSESLEFYSPLITQLLFNDTGVITSKADLERYFTIGLEKFPDLYFKLNHYFVGVNTVVLQYTSVNGKLASEVFLFGADGKAVSVYCNYATNT